MILSQVEQKEPGPGARSSHAIAVVGEKGYVFGGEFTPRVPVDDKMHVFDLKEKTWSVPSVKGDVPPPRVGVTMTALGDVIYIFGGRDVENTELNELYSFDTSANVWTLLSSGEIGPPHRSYHSATVDGNRVYVFGGCGVKGRLADLWAFDTVTGEWIKCPDPRNDCLPRGGPGLSASGGKIWVVYGFSGKELDDVHCFDPLTEKWSLIEDSGEKPSPRSVFCITSIGKYIIVYGGEIDPSDLGHLGAGQFSDELFSLDTETCVWKKMEVASDSDVLPGPRGWCAFSGGKLDDNKGVLVYGGNSPTNDRLGDIFFLNPSL